MRSSKKYNSFDIVKNSDIILIIVCVNHSLCQMSQSNKIYTCFTTKPPMLCATKIVGVLSEQTIAENIYITVFFIVQVQGIEELLSEIRNTKYIVWCKDVVISSVIPKSHYSCIREPLVLMKKRWPKGI